MKRVKIKSLNDLNNGDLALEGEQSSLLLVQSNEVLVFDSVDDHCAYLRTPCDCKEPSLYQPQGMTAMLFKRNTCVKCMRLPRRYME